MTDDRTLAALDERGRAAAAGVRTHVADRPVPVFDPDLLRISLDGDDRGTDRPRRSRPAIGVLAAAAAVVVVLAAVVALMGQTDDDSAPPASPIGPSELGRYVITDPPDGYEVSAVLDQRGQARPTQLEGFVYPGVPFGPVTAYGPGDDDPRIGVYAWPADSGTPDDPDDDVEVTLEEMEPSTVGGRQVWEWTRPELTAFRFVVEVGDGWYATVGGARATRDELLAVAAEVEVDADAADLAGGARATVPPTGLPDGWSGLGELEQYDLVPGVGVLRSETGGWLISYIHEEDDVQDVVYLTSTVGDPIRARAVQLSSDDTEEVTLRGHEAVVARTALVDVEPGFWSVTWEERPGEIVQLVASEVVGRDAVLAMAEDIRMADDDEVDDLRRRADQDDDGGTSSGGGTANGSTVVEGDAGTTIPGKEVEVARGTFSDGTGWQVSAGDGSLGFTVDGGSGSTSSEGFAGLDVPPRPLDQVGYGKADGIAWAYGRIGSDEVDSVRVATLTGEEVQASIYEADGVRVWVAELTPWLSDPEDGQILRATAYRADGSQLATSTIGG